MTRLDRIQLAILGLAGCALLAVVIPNVVKARRTPSTNACIANLKNIQGAIEQFAVEHKLTPTNRVTLDDISGGADKYIKQSINAELKCPAGGTYSVTTVGELPRCSTPTSGHAL